LITANRITSKDWRGYNGQGEGQGIRKEKGESQSFYLREDDFTQIKGDC